MAKDKANNENEVSHENVTSQTEKPSIDISRNDVDVNGVKIQVAVNDNRV